MLRKRKDRVITDEEQEEIRTKDFFDLITPSALRFFTGYYILGDTYRMVWAVKEYPPSTEAQAGFFAACRPKRRDLKDLSSAGRTDRAAKDHSKRCAKKQIKIRRQRCE